MTKKIVIDSTFKFRTEIFDLLNPPILVHVRVAGKRFRNRRFALNEMFQLKVSKFAILGISGLSRIKSPAREPAIICTSHYCIV